MVGDQNYFARSVIIATGAGTKWLGVPGEGKLIGMGVSSCAPCDAPFFKNKDVIVAGGGDSAMEEALVLTKYANSVTIVHRRNEFRASAAMQKKVFDNEKIKIIWDTEITEMQGENKLQAVVLRTNKGAVQAQELGEIEKLKEDNEFIYWKKPIDGVFVAIGHIPMTNPFRNIITVDEKGYIIPQPKNGYRSSTNVDGVFVAGDVHYTAYRQAITAAGFGCMAGMEALKYLDKETPSW
jgi:thioredoxin reductase (NADPH)